MIGSFNLRSSDRPNFGIVGNQPNRIFGHSLSETSAKVRPNRTLGWSLIFTTYMYFFTHKTYHINTRDFWSHILLEMGLKSADFWAKNIWKIFGIKKSYNFTKFSQKLAKNWPKIGQKSADFRFGRTPSFVRNFCTFPLTESSAELRPNRIFGRSLVIFIWFFIKNKSIYKSCLITDNRLKT